MGDKAEYGNWVSKRIIFLSGFLGFLFLGLGLVSIFGFGPCVLGLDNSCCNVPSSFRVFSVCSVPILSSRGKCARPHLDLGVSEFGLEWRGKGT